MSYKLNNKNTTHNIVCVKCCSKTWPCFQPFKKNTCLLFCREIVHLLRFAFNSFGEDTHLLFKAMNLTMLSRKENKLQTLATSLPTMVGHVTTVAKEQRIISTGYYRRCIKNRMVVKSRRYLFFQKKNSCLKKPFKEFTPTITQSTRLGLSFVCSTQHSNQQGSGATCFKAPGCFSQARCTKFRSARSSGDKYFNAIPSTM